MCEYLLSTVVIDDLNKKQRTLQYDLNSKDHKLPVLLRHPFRGRQMREELDGLEKDTGHGNHGDGTVYKTQKEILNCIVSLCKLLTTVCLSSHCSPSSARGLTRRKTVFVPSRSFKVRLEKSLISVFLRLT
jgi:hypothetical protein